MFVIEEELNKLPKKPGVYQMKDKDGEVIYVGKAINLYNRVRSYFRKDSQKDPKVKAMVKKIVSFEYIIVGNEVEALILESNFIKEKKPHYNILLRDDKSYPYIQITNEKYPRVRKIRNVKKDGSEYFGPFPNAVAVNDTIELIHDLFKIRNCNLNFDKGQSLDRPCLNYYIDRCPAPCVGKADEAEYLKDIDSIKRFLKGDTKDLTDYLQKQMLENSKKLNFELAARYRDYIQQIEIIMQKQRISKAGEDDIDLISYARGDRNVSIQMFFVRSGKIIDTENFIMKDDFKEDDSLVIASFMKQFYLNASYIPKEILVEKEPNDKEAIVGFLSKRKGSKVIVRKPLKGDKYEMMKMVRKNAIDALYKYEERKQRTERKLPLGLELLMKTINLDSARRIEAYDISNISGVQSVGSMVVFTNGIKDTREYRKFKIKTIDGADDYGSLREVLTRRISRGIKESQFTDAAGFGAKPDLIIMDGGKGQVNVAKEVLKEFDLDIKVIGLVKDDKHRTRGIIYNNEEIILDFSSPIYKFIYAIQEEAHRFAIEYHRKLRQRDQTNSILDEIPGIGKVRRRELLRHFKSVNNIKKASKEELAEVPQISLEIAENIIEFFRQRGE